MSTLCPSLFLSFTMLFCFNLILHVVIEWLERSTRSALLSSKRLQSWWRLLALQFSPQFCTSEVSFLSSDHLLSLLVVCPIVNGSENWLFVYALETLMTIIRFTRLFEKCFPIDINSLLSFLRVYDII